MTCNSHECGALWPPDPDGGGSHRADQTAQAPRAAARMWRPATLSGVEVLHACRVVGSETGETETIPYDIMHATPVMSAPDFVKQSPLALADNPLGWAKVDKFTMQSPDFPNVFALGDAGSTPNS